MDHKIEASHQAVANEKNQMGLLSKFIDFAQKTNPFYKNKKDKEGVDPNENNGTKQKSFKELRSDSTRLTETFLSDSTKLGPDDKLSDDGLVVKKDEMLFSKFLEIIETNNAGNLPDSSNVFGNRNKQIAGRLWVEFWRSPLNYRGYKYGRNKLVVYGISEYDGIKMLKNKEEIYLKYNTSYYKISNSDDFIPFNKVIDELTLLELNQL
jgi:hypothetical protein